MDNLYYEFLALNNQLVMLDYSLNKELFAIIEDNGDFKIQKYIFLGQFEDSVGTWYVLDVVTEKKRNRTYILKEKFRWFSTEEEATIKLWEQTAVRMVTQ